MPRALPIELRERIVHAHVEQEMKVDEISEVFNVSVRGLRHTESLTREKSVHCNEPSALGKFLV